MQSLTESEVRELLERRGYGFLGLSDGTQPYVIPMSFGFDGHRIYFQLNDEGRKITVLEDNGAACLTALEVDTERLVSRSVLVEGAVERVPESDHSEALAALAENATFGSDLSLWGEDLQDAELRLYALVPERVTGRSFGETVSRG